MRATPARARARLPLPAAAAALVSAAGFAGWSGTARAQTPGTPPDDGPLVIGPRSGFKLWELHSFSAQAEFFGQFEYDKQTTPGQPTLTTRDNLLRGTTNLSFESYIGHKNLIDLTGDVRLGYQDEELTSNVQGGNAHDRTFADFYNIQALILGEGPVPITAYTRRDETRQPREFASTLETITTESGVIAQINSDVAPTRLQYFHRDENQTDPIGTDNQELKQDTLSVSTSLRLSANQHLDLNYTFDHATQTAGAGPVDTYDRNDGTVTHTLDFGADNRSNLRSSLRFYSQSGQVDQSSLRLDENLLLHHTDHLESLYNLTLQDQKDHGAEQRLVSGNATVRHKLFESLVSTATLGGSRLEAPDPAGFHTDDVYINGTLDYTKKVPLGRLEAAAGLTFDHQTNSARGADLFVIDEAHTFTDPFNVVISKRNIIPSSIVITDLTHVQTYHEGTDYAVLASSAQVQIQRLFGSIVNGQTVLISYEIGPEPGSTIDTTTLSLSFRYTFDEGALNGLSVYLAYLQVQQDLSSVDPSQFVLDNVREFKYGAEYHIGDFSLLAEQRNHNSTISPYDATRLEARYDRRLDRDSALSLSVTDDIVDYKDPSNHVNLLQVTGRWTQRVRSGLDLSAYLQYRNQRDQVNGNVQGFEQAVELHWNYRQTQIYGSFRNSILNGSQGDRLSQTFVIGVTRSF